MKYTKYRYNTCHIFCQSTVLFFYTTFVHRGFIFHLERNRGVTNIIHRRPQQKHPSIKVDYKYSKTEIEFWITKIYKDTNGKLCLTIYCKPTEWQNYLHFKWAHPASLKKSIPYSQALSISNICNATIIDSRFYVWHTTEANFYIASVENFGKLMVCWQVFVN